MNHTGWSVFAAAVIACTWGGPAQCAAYPDKPIRLIVPFGPGGPADVLSRLIGKKLTESMGQSVVIDNRAGASTIIGTEIAARAPADGYTLLMISTTHTVNPSLYKKLPYDPVKDFTPVTMVAATPFMLVVHPSVPATTVAELVAYARAKPGALNYASSGNGSSIHLTTELFKAAAKIDMAHVPYKGSGPAFIDLIGGQVQMLFSSTVSSLPHVRSGKLRGLAVTSLKRAPGLANLPTIAESGYPGFESSSWFGVLVAAGTPSPIVDRLLAEISAGLRAPEVHEALSSQGAVPGGYARQEFAAYFVSEMKKWAAIVKAAQIRLE